MHNVSVRLHQFTKKGYHPGRSACVRSAWFIANAVTFDTWLLPHYRAKSLILRLFGARIGERVVIKPRVKIKHPWRLSVGDHSWIGEGAWIDNLADIEIGSNVCISQDAYLLTGNHDYTDPRFGLITRPIVVEDGAWIGARAVVCPGVRVASHSVLSVGSVLTKDTEPYGIYAGNPAGLLKRRVIAEPA